MRLRREDLRSLDVPAFEVLAEAHSDERKLLCFMHTAHFSPRKLAPKVMIQMCPSGKQDAHEFLWKRLFQKIQNETNAAKKKPRKEDLNGKESWEWYKQNYRSIFDALFGGLYESQVECKRCGHKSLTYDPFLDISLPISNKSLEGCLKTYFSDEELDKKESYRCSKCQKAVPATKRLKIFKPEKKKKNSMIHNR